MSIVFREEMRRLLHEAMLETHRGSLDAVENGLEAKLIETLAKLQEHRKTRKLINITPLFSLKVVTDDPRNKG